MKLVRDARILKTKGLSSLRTGLVSFNSFNEDGRSTTVLLHLQHACEMLIKAALSQKRIPIFDKKSATRKKYRLTPSELSNAVGLTTPKATALRRFLNIDSDESCRHVFEFGKSKFPCYSDKAVNLMKQALIDNDIDEVWRSRNIIEPPVYKEKTT